MQRKSRLHRKENCHIPLFIRLVWSVPYIGAVDKNVLKNKKFT